MRIQPRNEIAELFEAVHGSADKAELERAGIDPSSVFSILDFSASVNPFGPSTKVHAALEQVSFGRYPDRESVELKRVLGRSLDVADEQLIVANGSGELLWLIALSYLRSGDRVVIAGPTYSEYARSAILMGAQCVDCNAEVETGFSIPVESIHKSLKSAPPRILYLCNPNNPTGQFLDLATIEAWAHEFDQTLFVIDEAYVDFSWETKSLVGTRCKMKNVLILRSLSKAFGLAGLRLGYLIADPQIIRVLSSVRIPWSVNVVAQVAGAAALNDEQHLQHSLTQLREAKRSLVASLRGLGMKPIDSTTPFFLVPVANATKTRAKLLQANILVRDCTSFGLPEFIRIGTRHPSENARLVDALAKCVSA